MRILPIERIALNVLKFLQDAGAWICIGAGIILIIAGIVFAVKRSVMMTPAGVVGRVAYRQRRPSVLRILTCLAVGGVLTYGGWNFVTSLAESAYLKVLSIIVDDDLDYVDEIRTLHDIELSEPTVDEVLFAFEEAGGVLADGFSNTMTKMPDIVASMNRILVRAGLSPVDESVVESVISLAQSGDNFERRVDRSLPPL